jgi:hypothetical protein
MSIYDEWIAEGRPKRKLKCGCAVHYGGSEDGCIFPESLKLLAASAAFIRKCSDTSEKMGKRYEPRVLALIDMFFERIAKGER